MKFPDASGVPANMLPVRDGSALLQSSSQYCATSTPSAPATSLSSHPVPRPCIRAEQQELATLWYSGWYNGLAKKHALNVSRTGFTT
jgi:hypothetical protein